MKSETKEIGTLQQDAIAKAWTLVHEARYAQENVHDHAQLVHKARLHIIFRVIVNRWHCGQCEQPHIPKQHYEHGQMDLVCSINRDETQ